MARNFVTASSQYGEKASGVFSPLYPFTLACWVKPGSTTQSGTMLAYGISGGSGTHRMTLQMNGTAASPNTVFCAVTQATSAANTNGSTVYTTSNWYHVACVWRNVADREIYVNGASDGTSTTNVGTFNTFDRLYVGARMNLTLGQYVSGDVADAAVWNAALSLADLASLALGISPLLIKRGYLKHYFPLWGSGSTEVDLVAAGGLTMSGSPGVSTTTPRLRYAQ